MTPTTSEQAEVRTQIADDFKALTAAMLADFDTGRRQALDIVRGFADNAEARERIVRAAQAAVVADQRLEQREELALRDVCEALGLDPTEY